MNGNHPSLVGLLSLSLSFAALAQDELVFKDRQAFAEHKRDIELVPPSSFQLDKVLGEDLKIEVWAKSPLLYSPVAMDTDAQGRMWLTEGIDYTTFPSPRRITAGQSIVVVTDTMDPSFPPLVRGDIYKHIAYAVVP